VRAARRVQELRYIDEVATRHATRAVLVPWRDMAPAAALRATGTG
jgi:hypothetical protein